MVVIGASLAGCTTALHLAQSGISVALFDKAKFPRRKACGEGLSIQGVEELKLLGLHHLIEHIENVPFYGFRFFERRGSSEIILQPHVHGIGIRRYALDDALIIECRNQGIEVKTGEDVRVERLSPDRFRVYSGHQSIETRYLVLATGAHSTLPQAMGVPTFTRSQSRCGLSVPLLHNRKHSQSTVDIFIDSKIQACSTPVDPYTTTLSLFCSNDTAHRLAPANQAALLSEVCSRLGIEAHPSEPALTVSGLGRVYRNAHHDSVFIVGDALRQLDPIGGMGMTQALVSSRITAETINQLSNTSKKQAHQLLTAHHETLQRAVRKLVGYTSLTYWSLSTPLGRSTLGRQKVGALAKEVLLSMHRPSPLSTPYGLLSTLLIQSAGLW